MPFFTWLCRADVLCIDCGWLPSCCCWQPRAKKGRWELFTTHTALTSLLSNPPAVVWMESFAGSNSGRVDLKGPPLGARLSCFPSRRSSGHLFFDVITWAKTSASIIFIVSGTVQHGRAARCPLCPTDVSEAPPWSLTQPGWLCNHITIACLISFCHGWVSLPHPALLIPP